MLIIMSASKERQITCSSSFALNWSSVAITGTRDDFSGDWRGNDMYWTDRERRDGSYKLNN
jgi:hypothetical protein